MSKTMELSPRLAQVAALVPEGARLADVGTDHAYLPTHLLLEGRIPFAIAADLRKGPLERARQTAQQYGCGEKMAFRLCDGLSGIAPEEVDAVAIAGMGGETIAHILEGAPWVQQRGIPLVLQPMSTQPELRRWLIGHGYTIGEEYLVREGDTLYVVLLVQAGESRPLTEGEYLVGVQSRHPLRGAYLREQREKLERALAGMAQAQSEEVARRRTRLEGVLAELEKMEKEWNTWQ